jgi:peptidoglycan biosynthesis protein MviN/MurJ (putative lipid II flippase)
MTCIHCKSSQPVWTAATSSIIVFISTAGLVYAGMAATIYIHAVAWAGLHDHHKTSPTTCIAFAFSCSICMAVIGAATLVAAAAVLRTLHCPPLTHDD